MSLFNKILEKLGIKKDAPATVSAPVAAKPAPIATPPAAAPAAKPVAPAPAAQVMTPPPPAKSTVGSPVIAPAPPAVTPAPAPAPKPAAPAPISDIDVVKQLEEKAKGSGLDWKVSIVDLLKLLDLDSSREARNELAQELGCPPELMKDSAKMNTWLHKEVLRKIAENGGNIPQALLD